MIKRMICAVMFTCIATAANANQYPQQWQPQQYNTGNPYSNAQATLKGSVFIVPAGSQFPAVTTMEINSSQLNLELTENDLEFICNDPNMAALMNAYKPQMVQMMQNQLKTSLGTSFSETSVWTNVKIEGNTMYITDGGVDYKLTRIK